MSFISTNETTTMLLPDQASEDVAHIIHQPRISYTIPEFTLSFSNVDQLSLQDRTRASWLMENWIRDYYTGSHYHHQTTTTTTYIAEMQHFFILIAQNGQQAVVAKDHHVNIVTFNAYLSFGSNRSSNSFDGPAIIANPFWDFEANAKFARSLKLDMESFHDIALLLDPPVFGPVNATTQADSIVLPPPNRIHTNKTAADAQVSVWGTALGNTAVAVIVLFHLGVVTFLMMRLVRRWRSSTNVSILDNDDEDEIKSMRATPSTTPSSRPHAVSSGTPLGTIREEDDRSLENISVTDDDRDGQFYEGKFINNDGEESI
jgi:hypothetical protein